MCILVFFLLFFFLIIHAVVEVAFILVMRFYFENRMSVRCRLALASLKGRLSGCYGFADEDELQRRS